MSPNRFVHAATASFWVNVGREERAWTRGPLRHSGFVLVVNVRAISRLVDQSCRETKRVVDSPTVCHSIMQKLACMLATTASELSCLKRMRPLLNLACIKARISTAMAGI